jgi:hypothetical protein
MSQELAVTPASSTALALVDDGWKAAADEGGQRILRGTLVKFADWQWTAGKEAARIPPEREFVATETIAAWVKWQGGKPVEYIVRASGADLPEREELGDTAEGTWELTPNNEPKDPWANTRLVRLLDPVTAEVFTFTTSSWGGRNAVIDLADQIVRMRQAHPGAVPVVQLDALPMQTRYGRKSKPLFKIVGWKCPAGNNQPTDGQPQNQVEHSVNDLDDELPF